MIICNNAASCSLFCDHERNEPNNYCLHTPNWIPSFRVIITHTHANSFVRLKTTTWCYHLNARRLKRVLLWKNDLAKIETIFIRTIYKVKNAIVPFEKIIRIWTSYKIIKFFIISLCNLHIFLL